MVPRTVSASLACAALVVLGGCAGEGNAPVPDLLVQDVPGYTFDGASDPVAVAGMCGVHDALSKLGTVEKQLGFTAGQDHVRFVRYSVADDQAWAAASAGIDKCEPSTYVSMSGSVSLVSTADLRVESGPEVGDDRRWYTIDSDVKDSLGYTNRVPATTTHGVIIAIDGYIISVTAPTQAEVEKYVTAALT